MYAAAQVGAALGAAWHVREAKCRCASKLRLCTVRERLQRTTGSPQGPSAIALHASPS